MKKDNKDNKDNKQTKWIKAKDLLEDEVSLISSTNILKEQKINNNLNLCLKAFQIEILIQKFKKKNSKIIISNGAMLNEVIPIITVLDANNNLTFYDEIKEFLFELRNNYGLMCKVLDSIPQKMQSKVTPLLSHFFYENIYSESTVQEEIFNFYYLLLEREISNLKTLSTGTFLQKSFLGKMFLELHNNHEIQSYLNSTIISLLEDLEKKFPEFLSLDLLRKQEKKEKNIIEEENNNTSNAASKKRINTVMTNPDDIKSSLRAFSIGRIASGALTYISEYNKKLNYFLGEKELNDIFYDREDPKEKHEDEINKTKVETEEERKFQQSYILKMLKFLRVRGNISEVSNENLLFKVQRNKQEGIEGNLTQYFEAYDLIINFIKALFEKLNNMTIVPYLIRFIGKIIYELIKKKFPKISELDRQSFVAQFFFSKLIFPILMNPDMSSLCANTLISKGTRKNILNILMILEKFIKGDFFSAQSCANLTIFNRFFIDNILLLKRFIDKLIDIELPSNIIEYLNNINFEEEYDTDKRGEQIKYDYFARYPDDFLFNQTICFCPEELLTLIEAGERLEYFTSESCRPKLKSSFKKISEFKEKFEKKNLEEITYYVIMKDEYKDEVKDFMKRKEKKYKFSAEFNQDELDEIFYCMSQVLSNTNFIFGTEWFSEKNTTLQCFEKIYQYTLLTKDNRAIPINWYCQYLTSNLPKLSKEYQENDFNLLYETMIDHIQNQIKFLKNLLNFFSTQMSRKIFFLEQKLGFYEDDLNEILSAQVHIKAFYFIEKFEFKTDVTITPSSETSATNTQDEGELKVICKNILGFIEQFTSFSSIYKEIEETKQQGDSDPQRILETFMDCLTEEIGKDPSMVGFCTENKIIDELLLKKFGASVQINEAIKSKMNLIIWNFILKHFCVKVYKSNPCVKDEEFITICNTLSTIDPIKDLKIPKEFLNQTIFDEIVNCLLQMDLYLGPQEKFDAFSSAIQKITALFTFTLQKDRPEAGDLLPVIIYSVLSAKPERLWWTCQFLNYFLTNNQKMGHDGYNLTQIESAMVYIQQYYFKG